MKRRGGGEELENLTMTTLRIRTAFIAFMLLAWGMSFAVALDFPMLTGRVVDEAGILDTGTRAALTEKLAALEAKTTDQFVVVTLKSLQGTSIEDFGVQLGNAWKVGQKDKNNGVLLIVAPNERKVRIEVGRGLEGTLTDAISKNIIEYTIIPHFRANDFVGGISHGADAIVLALSTPSVPTQLYTSRSSSTACNNGFAVMGGPFSVFGMVKGVNVLEWRRLVDETFRNQILEQALQEGLSACPTVKAGQIVMYGGDRELLVAWTMLNPINWIIVRTNVQAEIQREEARIARERAEQERPELEALAQKVEAEAKESRRLAALADCGSRPNLAGGPSLSSTYSVAANDETRRVGMLCVKSVEYISAAPTPYGGNAARARFTGYSASDFEPLVVIADFVY
jgi:uncharacterized membrane protein YgcG